MPLNIENIKKEYGHLVKNIRFDEEYQIRIDRKTRWGNPFKLTIDTPQNRRLVLHRHYGWLQEQIRTGQIAIEELAALAGKTLGCWCCPNDCHGHILAYAAQQCKLHIEKKAA